MAVAPANSAAGALNLSTDGHANVTTMTVASTQTPTCTARFDLFGTPRGCPRAPPGRGRGPTTCSTAGPADTGDYQFGSRTYDTRIGSFLGPDTYRAASPHQDRGVRVDPLTRNSYAYLNGPRQRFRPQRPLPRERLRGRGHRGHRGGDRRGSRH